VLFRSDWKQAQQYVASRDSDGSPEDEWVVLGNDDPWSGHGIVAQTSVAGNVVSYEFELTPYDEFIYDDEGASTVRTLQPYDQVGLDIIVGSTLLSGTGFGMVNIEGYDSANPKFDSPLYWLDHTLGGTVSGDADLDNDVDADDLATWGANYTGDAGSGKSWFNGDFDGDGDVDADDLATWGANYTGAGGAPLMADVPEPATMTLLAIGGVALIRRRRK